MNKPVIFIFMLMMLINNSIVRSENNVEKKPTAKETKIKGKLEGIWQKCEIQSKNEDGSYKVYGQPFFKIYKPKEKRFENIHVNLPSKLFDVSIAGKTKKKSDTQYLEIITYSIFNDIPVNAEILITYKFVSENVITTFFNRPSDMNMIQEIWMRVDDNYKPLQDIIHL